MLGIVEPEKSIIKLTRRERDTLLECEREVEASISEFLRCGRALSTIRQKRLYRETHPTFDQYVKERWGLGVGATGTLITSYHIAEQLEEAGIELPAQITQSVMRSLSKVSPVEGLRVAAWRYAVTLSPGASCPPISLLQRITRIIRDALDAGDNVDGAGNRVDEEVEESEDSNSGRPPGHGRKYVEKTDPDQRFLRAVTRLSAYNGFSVPLIASQVTSDQMASYVWRSCERLKSRLDEVEQALLRQFPNAQAAAT
jgi:hypothetical protein